MIAFLTYTSLISLALGAAGAVSGILSSMLGVGLMLAGIALLALTFFLAFFSFLRHGAGGTNLLAFFLGLLSLAALGGLGWLYSQNPLSDITTDLRNPPQFLHPAYRLSVERGAEYLDKSLQIDRTYDQAVAASQAIYYPGFDGIALSAPPKEVYAEAMKAIRTQLPDWKVALDDPAKFHAEFETQWTPFRVEYDIVLEVRPVHNHDFDSIIELRSRSRFGLLGDFGANIYRLRELKVRLNFVTKPLEEKFVEARAEWEKENAEEVEVPPPPTAPAAPAAAPPKGVSP